MSDLTVRGREKLLLAGSSSGKRIEITVCSDCGRMRTILFLANGAWLCTACRNSGSQQPTVVPLSRGGTIYAKRNLPGRRS